MKTLTEQIKAALEKPEGAELRAQAALLRDFHGGADLIYRLLLANKELQQKVEAQTGNNPKLLAGVEALTKPDYHELNKHDGRNDRLLHAVLCAYAKHQLDCPDIGWNELGDMLMHVICNEIGDDAFVEWGEKIKEGPR